MPNGTVAVQYARLAVGGAAGRARSSLVDPVCDRWEPCWKLIFGPRSTTHIPAHDGVELECTEVLGEKLDQPLGVFDDGLPDLGTLDDDPRHEVSECIFATAVHGKESHATQVPIEEVLDGCFLLPNLRLALWVIGAVVVRHPLTWTRRDLSG